MKFQCTLLYLLQFNKEYFYKISSYLTPESKRELITKGYLVSKLGFMDSNKHHPQHEIKSDYFVKSVGSPTAVCTLYLNFREFTKKFTFFTHNQSHSNANLCHLKNL